jgi:hypothetical protein
MSDRRYMNQKAAGISIDAISLSVYDRQVAQRVQYVVAQVINSHAGAPEEEVRQILTHRLRGMGVNPNPRETQQIAELIAGLPKAK